MKQLSPQDVASFQRFISRWYFQHGRHQLPWRQDYEPYKVLVSETMLQQTQVERVIPKFLSFINKFPTVHVLSQASVADVITLWQGLGYNRRGLNLLKAAHYLQTNFEGKIPASYDELVQLPGVGPYTATAVMVFSFNQPAIVIETNIRTVFIHHFFPEKESVSDTELRPLLQMTMDHNNPRAWYSALMDYGTYLKKVLPNPSRKSKHFTKQSAFKGSLRQVRGEIIKALSLNEQLSEQELLDTISGNKQRFTEALTQLRKEGFIYFSNSSFKLHTNPKV